MNKMVSKNNNWHLLWVIAKTDFILRYNGSLLGYLWAFLKPMLLFLVMYIVFSIFMKWDMPNYQLYLFLGIMLWNFFAEGTSAGICSLLNKGNLIKKIYFPRILIVIASSITALMTLVLNLIVFFIFYLFKGLELHWHILLIIPLLFILYLLVLSISLLLSTLQVKYRDIIQIWEVILQVVFFLTPIIYPLTLVDSKFYFYLYLNPLVGIIQFARESILNQTILDLDIIIYTVFIVVGLYILGYLTYKKLAPNIAEEL